MRLLDLFSGAGGAAFGYYRAGFTEIVGVDIAPMPRYPFEFVQADALEFLRSVKPGEYDLIHASPPCQAHSILKASTGKEYPDLVAPVRDELRRIGTPYVIENVPGAPLIDPVMLCGLMFGLKVYRHRLFECSEFLMAIPHRKHEEKCPRAGTRRISSGFISVCGSVSNVRYARRAMDIPWMTGADLAQSIPPAYTNWIGRQMLL